MVDLLDPDPAGDIMSDGSKKYGLFAMSGDNEKGKLRFVGVRGSEPCPGNWK